MNKTQQKFYYLFFSFLFYVSIIILGASVIITIMISFSSSNLFESEFLNNSWIVRYTISEKVFLIFKLPISIIQEHTPIETRVKAIIIIYTIVNSLMAQILYLFSFLFIRKILESIQVGSSIFSLNSIRKVKILTILFSSFYLTKDFLLTSIINYFYLDIVFFNFTNLNLEILLITALMFVLIDIFHYGNYLQDEYDSVL